MKILILVFIIAPSWSSCRNYTTEQIENLSNYALVKKDTFSNEYIREAYVFKFNYSYTYQKMTAIHAGTRTESFYKNGRLNGCHLSYGQDGRLILKGYYQNGSKDGRWLSYQYYDSGVVTECETYKEGKLTSTGCQ